MSNNMDKELNLDHAIMGNLSWLKPKLKLLNESLDNYDNLDEETKGIIDNIASILIKIHDIIFFKQ